MHEFTAVVVEEENAVGVNAVVVFELGEDSIVFTFGFAEGDAPV